MNGTNIRCMDKLNPDNSRFYLSRKLIGVVSVFLIAASGLVVLTNFSINMIAATGDYMRLISTWSEQHHQSVVSLERYARSGEENDYQKYLESTDKMREQTRVIDELFKADPNMEVIFESYGTENIYPNEISSLALAFYQFKDLKRVQEIYRKWEQLNRYERGKQKVAQRINLEWNSAQPDEEKLNEYLTVLNKLNQSWNNSSQELVTMVGVASSVVKRAGLWVSVILGILLVLIGLVVTVRANKSIGRWEQTLSEKEVLLSEIHHRVKNNMAVISGLLELESMQSRDPEQALKDSRDRIQSMAMIHEILYESDSFSEINLGQYLNKLTNYIADTYIHDQKDINLRIHFDEILVSINQAIPVGLVVNEMLANIIIHGFNGSPGGQIALMLTEIDGKISLSIRDDSDGYSEDLNYGSAESSGAMIVNTLVEQLDAEVTFNNEERDGFHLQFKKSHASGSGNANL